MDAAAVEMLRQVRDEVAALRREQADLGIELFDRLARLVQTPASTNGAGEALLAGIAAEFGEHEFLAVELMSWCSPCFDHAQRDAYQALCTLCTDEDPTSLQAGMALRALARMAPRGALRIERRGERRGTALWAVVRE